LQWIAASGFCPSACCGTGSNCSLYSVLLIEGDVMQVAFPIVLDMYEFCSDEMKKQLDGPREAVRHEEDRKANADRAVKKAKKVCCACIASLVHVTCCHVLSSKCCEQKTPS